MTEPTVESSPDSRRFHASDDETFRVRSKALGDETRLAIYREIARREIPVSVADILGIFELNHTTVRQHLAKLRDADLIEEVADTPHGPGRPRILYRLTADAAAEWNDEGPYERLSMLLLEVATTDETPLNVGRAAGRAMRVDHGAGDDPLDAFTAAVVAQGFAPVGSTLKTADAAGGVDVVLGNCPFEAAARANPEVVCALHRGMVEGLAEQIGGLSVVDFAASDPHGAGCRVRLERSPAGD